MTTVLCTNAYKAAYKANKARTKNNSLPIASTMLIRHHDHHMLFTPFAWKEHAELTEAIPARIDGDEWSTCVPAKPFIDWLRVTQLGRGENDQIELTFRDEIQMLYIKAGNARAEFKCLDAMEFPTFQD